MILTTKTHGRGPHVWQGDDDDDDDDGERLECRLKLHTSHQLSRRRQKKNQNRNPRETKEKNHVGLEQAWHTMLKTTSSLHGATNPTRAQLGLQASSDAPSTRSMPQSGSKVVLIHL